MLEALPDRTRERQSSSTRDSQLVRQIRKPDIAFATRESQMKLKVY
jgi:hypothetical protein